MSRYFIYCLTIYLILPIVVKSDEALTVTTKSGTVKGKLLKSIFEKKSYVSYFGIPYAEAPVGKLRFQEPQPYNGWEGVLEAVKLPKPCNQFYHPVRHRPFGYGFFGFEDCLYLSISTPQVEEPLEDLPVIVFLINEQFKNSLNSTKRYFPDFFIEENVIIVNINHRLSSLGFLTTEDEYAPANNGLRDIILALEWIKENIGAFGGDSNKVTLMGSFGGAVAVDLLLHSEKAKGLFSAAILQSGTSFNPSYLNDDQKKYAFGLGEKLEISSSKSSDLIKALQEKDPQSLVEHDMTIVSIDESRGTQRGILAFTPTLEINKTNAVITAAPENSETKMDIPLMVGFNSREGIDLTSRFLHKPEFLTYLERDFQFIFPIRTNYHFSLRDSIFDEAIQEIRHFYFEDGTVKISKPGEFITYAADIHQVYAIDYMVRNYANVSSQPIYYYYFDYSSDLNMNKWEVLSTAKVWDGVWGANIGDELCYLFVCNPLRKVYKNLKENSPESLALKILKKMVRLWSNFARTRDPTPNGDEVLEGLKWDPVTPTTKNYLKIHKTFEMKQNPIHGRIKFWDNFLEKYSRILREKTVETDHDEL